MIVSFFIFNIIRTKINLKIYALFIFYIYLDLSKKKVDCIIIDIKVRCECPKGNAQCSHMAATMFYTHYNISLTDQPRAWLSKAPC